MSSAAPRPTEHTDIARQEILAANLRYGSTAEPLRTRAYAHVVAKVLLASGRFTPLSVDRIRKKCAELIGSGAPSKDRVEAALQLLAKEQMVEQIGSKYRLRPRVLEELTQQITVRRGRVTSILNRHFPGEINPERLRAWFDATAVRFFAIYGDRWVASAAHGKEVRADPRGDLQQIVATVAAEHGLQERVEELAHSFLEFIRSADPEDNEMLWHYGRSMFAARLMTADLAADPISARELSGSIILLDTNVLLEIALEHQDQRSTLEGLGRALQSLGIRLGYLHVTRDEYRKVVASWREKTLNSVDQHGAHVVRAADDRYIRSAVQHGCVHGYEFATFFDELERLPGALEEHTPIVELDDPEVAQAAQAGANDPQIVQAIRTVWIEHRPYEKSEANARHDAALTGVAKMYRARGEQCIVLSNDRTMQVLASRWSRPTGIPLWITLDVLLQVLAVEEEGSGMDATMFAPLLSRLIANEVEVRAITYTVEDLQWLHSLNQRVAELPASEIQKMAKLIHRQRMAGVARNDPELRLEVERAYQRARRNLGTDLAEAQAKVAAEQQARERAELDRSHLADELLQVKVARRAEAIRKRAFWQAIRLGGVWFLGMLLAAVLVIVVFDWARVGASPVETVGLASTLGAPVIAAALVLWKYILPRYRERVEEAPREARESILREEQQL